MKCRPTSADAPAWRGDRRAALLAVLLPSDETRLPILDSVSVLVLPTLLLVVCPKLLRVDDRPLGGEVVLDLLKRRLLERPLALLRLPTGVGRLRLG